MLPAAAIFSLALAAPGAPPGLGMASGSWPFAEPRRGPPSDYRSRVEARLERALPADERGCFLYAFEDLDGDGRDEVLVFVEAFGVCGSAGCPLYALRNGAHGLVHLSRTEAVRNVFLVPRRGPGRRPLIVEKWGGVLRHVRPAGSGYPRIIDERTSTAVHTLPARARPPSWTAAEGCANQEEVRRGLGI